MTTESQHQPPAVAPAPLLRPALAAAISGAAAVVAGAVLSGSPGALGALVGALLVLAVLGLGSMSVNVVAGLLPSAALLVALLTYTLQVLAMALAFVALTRSGLLGDQLSREWLAGAVVAGVLAWLTLHVATAMTARIPAYDAAPAARSQAGAR
jgi:ATP synthase protein I